MAYAGARPPFELDDAAADFPIRKSNRERAKQGASQRAAVVDLENEPRSRPRKAKRHETFRCRHCHTLVGPTLSGGRHRNHCPVCLHSLHVDGKTPGDRASDCRSLMAPVGLFARPSGEQVIVHQCLGCGFQRFNRVAADDSPLMVMRLPLIEPLSRAREAVEIERFAAQ